MQVTRAVTQPILKNKNKIYYKVKFSKKTISCEYLNKKPEAKSSFASIHELTAVQCDKLNRNLVAIKLTRIELYHRP